MRDALLNFGKIQAATKATVAYSANVCDMDAVEKSGNVDQANVCFIPAADLASGDTITCQLYDSADNSTYALCVSGIAVEAKKGEKIVLPMPRKHRRYLKAAVLPGSSDTFTAKDVNACVELGY